MSTTGGSSAQRPSAGAFRRGTVYYSIADELPDLTEEERSKFEAVMKKAQEFEAEEEHKMRQPLEGQLYKYTNVMKGWQYRWFVLTPDTGMLEYYMLEERKKDRPRGGLHLAGAVITVSDEDNQSFVVNALCGEVFKLKAHDAKDRQVWVDRLRAVIENCKSSTPKKLVAPSSSQQLTDVSPSPLSLTQFHVASDAVTASAGVGPAIFEGSGSPTAATDKLNENVIDSICDIKESVCKAVESQKTLARAIEDLPYSGSGIKCSDRGLLVLKATSQAAVQSLEQCYLILRRRQREALLSSVMPVGTAVEFMEKYRSPIMK